MMTAIRDWLDALVIVSMVLAVADALIPQGAIRKIAGFTGGLILLLTLLRPLTGDSSHLRLELNRYAAAVEDRQEELEKVGIEALSDGIAEGTVAYIQDKAASLGLAVTASVWTEVGTDGIPRPWSAEITGQKSEALASYMERELDIPRERQVWHEDG